MADLGSEDLKEREVVLVSKVMISDIDKE